MGNKLNDTDYFIKRDNKICSKFDTLISIFPDELNNSGNYNFKSTPPKKYCPNGSCNNDIDKINGYCVWLFNLIYGDKIDFSNNADNNTNIVTYILAWLSYKLSQKPQSEITTLKDFYNKHMENIPEYNKSIENDTKYKTYISLININKKLMDIDIKVMSKFYVVFKNLCKMYNDLSKANTNGAEYLKYVNNFVDNYNALFNDTNSNLFKQVLFAVSNDYNHIKSTLSFESVRKQFPELTNKKTETQVSTSSPKETQMDDSSSKIPVSISQTEGSSSQSGVSDSQSGVSDSETTLFSSLTINKLIPIPFILVVTLILLGIAYKYSLFGFRKRSQKQHLREKLKK
ncbi:hypothetical protein YYC_02869 [Plasmodium yoelii 17X]|uniref:YIR protein n=1 Tax=Plasmodium yoelii 17X TaxID=1323249 RepID=V7PIG4_PLAYE|nr:hypothetical protein YYC_02869 [Plasmodium yoelii 17X]